MYRNKLIHETSPYLLQHAHNPVNWYPWGEEALQKAKKEDKPILVSIGYAACHWCHVMERESFEDESTAAIMNEHFVNIKIDREERPDLDHIYMDAVQALTGSGGWPLNVFLTPDAKPFFGGTYFPPQRVFNRPSWKEVLLSVIKAYKERRHDINAQAENLTAHLRKAISFGFQKSPECEILGFKSADEVFKQIMQEADIHWGGFSKAPKFPQTFIIQFLLRYHHSTGNEQSLKQAILSLDKMIEGGIYDQLGGGFARYATDTEWLVPHFEKMLYDNALLISVISEAYQLTKKQRYREVIEETLQFVQQEMMNENGGFYTALDADSEGEEGKYYVWQSGEVQELLGDDSALFCRFYDITEKGNWEGKNILRVKKPAELFARENNLNPNEWNEILTRSKTKLLNHRQKRKKPFLDDKVILGWNALMNTALCKAYAATGNSFYLEMAEKNIQFLMTNLKTTHSSAWMHTYKNGQAKFSAFLDDYAFLIEAMIHLQEITAQSHWLDKAAELTEYVTEHFEEEGTGFFFYTPKDQLDVIIRKKEVYDGALPSGNSVMAYNLHRLGILLDKPEWQKQAGEMVIALSKAITTYPTSFGNWACLLLEKIVGTKEIAVIGKEYSELLSEVLRIYIPHRVIMGSETDHKRYPLLTGRTAAGKTAIYLCSNYTCKFPVFGINELITLINKEKTQ